MNLPTLLFLSFTFFNVPWEGRTLIVGRMHAREHAPLDTALWLQTWIQNLTVDNPRGSVIVVPDLSGPPRYSCDRLGVESIDLNRDYPYRWKHSTNPETRTGDGPLTSSISRDMKVLVDTYQPTRVLILHQGELSLYSPWDSSFATPPPNLVDPCTLVPLEWKQAVSGEVQTMYPRVGDTIKCGPAGLNSGYLATGTLADYVAATVSVARIILTVELGGNPSAEKCEDVFKESVHPVTLIPFLSS